MSPILSVLLTLVHFPPQKIEEQRITIEDLEVLKELTDELEENHIQVEREHRDEILDREKDLREEKRTRFHAFSAARVCYGCAPDGNDGVAEFETPILGGQEPYDDAKKTHLIGRLMCSPSPGSLNYFPASPTPAPHEFVSPPSSSPNKKYSKKDADVMAV
ncbi:hypothetical protein P692DRAFT_20882350 [Suillus brevipes Sb2]|nr:hypothetical protein P692DRAFT_20882350 [Suillus brevipes Sb2]